MRDRSARPWLSNLRIEAEMAYSLLIVVENIGGSSELMLNG